MEDLAERRKRIYELIEESRHQSDVNTLIDIHLELRQMQFEIQEKEGLARRQYLMAEVLRKDSEDTTVNSLTEPPNAMSVNRAEPKARITAKPLREAEKTLEGEYRDLESLRYTMSGYCDALQQKIAGLRKEMEIESMRQH